MKDQTDRIVAAVKATGRIVDNVSNVITATNAVGVAASVGFDLAAMLAMVENESGGRNVWGSDPLEGPFTELALDPAWGLNEQHVTQADYTRYKLRRDKGMQPQGCGPAQLTSAGLQVEAEQAGGCWEPYPNILVGARFLRHLFLAAGSARGGFGAYNGSGPDGAYAVDAVERQANWQRVIDAAIAAK